MSRLALLPLALVLAAGCTVESLDGDQGIRTRSSLEYIETHEAEIIAVMEYAQGQLEEGGIVTPLLDEDPATFVPRTRDKLWGLYNDDRILSMSRISDYSAGGMAIGSNTPENEGDDKIYIADDRSGGNYMFSASVLYHEGEHYNYGFHDHCMRQITNDPNSLSDEIDRATVRCGDVPYWAGDGISWLMRKWIPTMVPYEILFRERLNSSSNEDALISWKCGEARAKSEVSRSVWAGGSGNDDGNSKWQPTLGYSEDGVEELFMDPFFDDAFNAFRTTHRERLAWLEEEFGCDVI